MPVDKFADRLYTPLARVTVTRKQIHTLRTEAREAGDEITVAICDVALAAWLGEIAVIDESVRSDLERLGIVPEHVGADLAARAKIAEMLAVVSR